MSHSQLHPLKINPSTGEPYLRLPSPLQHIIVTPIRLSDGPSLVSILNDPKVCKWLEGPPYPYLPSHGESWVAARKQESDTILQYLEQASRDTPDGPLKLVEECPVRILREVKEDGSDILLGDVEFRRCSFSYEEPEIQQQLSEENARRELGDPEIVWCIGDHLASSHHGRGIMSLALRTLLTMWAIPRMGARRFRVEAFIGNVGSVRVFEKNGFVVEKTVERATVNNFGASRAGAHILRRDEI